MSVAVQSRRPVARDVFQWISYLQYPAVLVTLGYVLKSGIDVAQVARNGWAPVFDGWNYALLYAGVAIGLSSLQDPARTQNEISLRVWRNPRAGRWMLGVLAAYAGLAMAGGLVGAYRADTTVVAQLSMGLVAFGLGMVGLLKTAMEMREHHRGDRAGGEAGA